MTTTVLLTGGSGFIGRNLVESLGSTYRLLAPTRKEMDLLDADSVAAYLRAHPADVLIHSATTPGHRNSKATAPVFESTLQMFFNLMAHRRRFGKLINLGTGAEYDMRHYQPKMKESYFGQHIPVDVTGFSKYIISRFLEADPQAIHLRLFGVFGKYEDYEIRFVSNAICKALHDRPITIKQNRKFDYLLIGDLAPILRHFIESTPRHKVYNVTPDESVELKLLAELVRDIAGKPNLEIQIAQPGMGAEYSGDNERLRKEIGGLQLTPFRQSIQNLYAWYSDQKKWVREEALLVDK